ncbi:unnamed protein product [Arctogadus glacialis]
MGEPGEATDKELTQWHGTEMSLGSTAMQHKNSRHTAHAEASIQHGSAELTPAVISQLYALTVSLLPM